MTNLSDSLLGPSSQLLLFNFDNVISKFQIWIYGNSFESFLVAVVNPNVQAIERWANDNGLSGDFASLCESPKVKEFILGELSKIGKEKKVSFKYMK